MSAIDTSRLNKEDLANRRMMLALVLSLVLHGVILSLQFGLPGAGLPSLEMPFQKKRAAPGSITVQLTQSAAAPASQQSPQEQASQLQQTAATPAPAASVAAEARDHAVTAAPAPVTAAASAASSVKSATALSLVKLAPTPAASQPKSAKASPKAKPSAQVARPNSARQKKVLAPETQRLLTQNGWNEDGFVVAANPPHELQKPETDDIRKVYDDIQQEGVDDPDERAKRQLEIEQKRQQKRLQEQIKVQQKIQQELTQQTELKQAQQQLQQQLQEQSQQIEQQLQAQAEQEKKVAEQIKLAEAEQLRQQELKQQAAQQAAQLAAQQAALQAAQQQRAELERQQQEQLAEQQQRQERQNLIAQRQAEQAQQRQYKEAQKARQLSELKPDLTQQMQQLQQSNQQVLQKLQQELQRDEQERLASEARERAANAEASQLAQQRAAQQRADARQEKINSQLRQGAVSDLQSLSNQLAQAPVAIAAAKPSVSTGLSSGSDPLAAARPVNEGGNKGAGNERGNSTATGIASQQAGTNRAPLDLTGSVREQLKQLDRNRATSLAASDEGDKRRRRSLLGEQERDVPLRLYIDSWKHKVERNANLNYSQLAKDRARGDPVVTVAIRSDGSVEDIIINRSSGRADLDEAVRRIVKINAKYAAFPPNVAAVYDVIEIRKVWLFEEVLRVIDEVR